VGDRDEQSGTKISSRDEVREQDSQRLQLLQVKGEQVNEPATNGYNLTKFSKTIVFEKWRSDLKQVNCDELG
jgi:hypothetical protein